MSVHRVWELAKETFKIQGGTIHQIAERLNMSGNSYLVDLFLQNGEDCQVKIGDNWHSAVFMEYTAIKMDKEGKHWLAGSAFVPGFNAGGYLTNLKVGYNLRYPISQ